MNRVDLRRELSNIFEQRFSISYEKSNKNIYNFIIGMQKDAIKNAKFLIQSHTTTDGILEPFNQNPLTTIYELVEFLNKIYEDKKCNCFPL